MGRPKGSKNKKSATSTATSIKKLNRPDNISTKEELQEYLNNNLDIEYPFDEMLWEKCVEKAEESKKSGEVKFKVVTETDADGNVKTNKIPINANPTTPIKWYWRLGNMSQYKKRGEIARANILLGNSGTETSQEIKQTYFTPDGSSEANPILAWIGSFKNIEERIYLQARYANYLDCYDINDGADTTIFFTILGYEVDIYRLNKIRAQGGKVDSSEIAKLSKALTDLIESMKWARKQRSAKDEAAQNRFTVIMDRMCENGVFEPDGDDYDDDEIDFLLQNIPIYLQKMDWQNGG